MKVQDMTTSIRPALNYLRVKDVKLPATRQNNKMMKLLTHEVPIYEDDKEDKVYSR